MQQVNESEALRMVLEKADAIIKTEDFEPGYRGIVVESVSGKEFFADRNDFEGTVIYFPGVKLSQLSKR